MSRKIFLFFSKKVSICSRISPFGADDFVCVSGFFMPGIDIGSKVEKFYGLGDGSLL